MLAKMPMRISPPNMPNMEDKKAVAKVATRIRAVIKMLMR
jgi:hypothetical protein